MPTLLQLNSTANWGSTGKIAEQIGILAQQNGWEVYMAYCRKILPSSLQIIRVGNKLSPYLHYAEHRLFNNDGLASRTATKRLIRQIDELHPDIVHLHNIHDHYVNYRILLAHLAEMKIPVVWTLHDCWNFTGACAYFDRTGCERWKTECVKCPEKNWLFQGRTLYQFRLKKELQNRIQNLTFVPVSNWLGDLLRQSHQSNRRIEVIHNGVDLDVFHPYPVVNHQEKMILGVAAVWSERKGLNDFIALRAMLPVEYSIVLVGLTEAQIKSLPAGVHGIQRTTNQAELAKLYSQAIAFVNPTYSDNFPTTNIEALACGTPVITYRTGGSPEAVTPETGKVVEQGDIQGMADAILSLQSQPLSRLACRQRAETHYDKNKNFEQYIQLYELLLDVQ
jgi:glycosyltransferase involved in cell wall biosynthesis